MCGKKGLSQLEGILRLKLKYARTSKRSSAWPCPESLLTKFRSTRPYYFSRHQSNAGCPRKALSITPFT